MTLPGDSGTTSFLSTSEVLEALERRILDGTWAADSRLPSERQLSLDFRVSRPVIREALRGLEERGHITIAPGRGSFVRPASENDLSAPLFRLALRVGVTPRDIVMSRLVLECAAAETAATIASAEQIADLHEALLLHTAARTIEERVATDIAFHERIIKCTGNPVTEIMFGSIRDLTLGIMLRSHADGGVHDAGDPLHDKIYDAIANRDPAGARAAMHEHVALALTLYGDDIDRDLGDVLQRYATSPTARPVEASKTPKP